MASARTLACLVAASTLGLAATADDPPTPAPSPVVQVALKVAGIDYPARVANDTALQNFILVSREAMAEVFDVTVDGVSVSVSPPELGPTSEPTAGLTAEPALVASDTALQNFIRFSREALGEVFDVTVDRVSVSVSQGFVTVEVTICPLEPCPMPEPTPGPTPEPTSAPTPAPTPEPTPSPTSRPAPAPLPVVQVSLKVTGIDYPALVANDTALQNFILVSREALAESFDVPVERVSVSASQGCVMVEGTILPPEGTLALELLQRVNKTQIATTALQYIEDADGAGRLGFSRTGDLKIDEVRTEVAVPAYTCTCLDGTAATGASCTADNAKRCAQCNDGFELNDDAACEVSVIGDAVTDNSSGCTYQFLGGGYCHPDGEEFEKKLRISDWLEGDRQAAEGVCCEDLGCGGFHLDKDIPDFVMLRDLAIVQDRFSWKRRECWKKATQHGKKLSGAPLQAPPLAAVAAVAWLLRAAGA